MSDSAEELVSVDETWAAYKPERRSIESIIPHEGNPRTHPESQIEQIANSIEEWGWTFPILIDESNNILSGHGRFMAAKRLGINEVPCLVASGWSKAKKTAYIIADNKLGELSFWDDDLLKNLILEMNEDLDFDDSFNLDLLGFDKDELNEFLLEGKEGLTDDDAIPDPPDEPITQVGDLWLLGDHRLLCGDSTSIDAVEMLMDGNKSDITFTSPPYNIGLSSLDTHIVAGKKSKAGYKYSNNTDNLSTVGYKTFLNDYTTVALTVSDYVFSNIQSLAGNKIALIEHLYDMREKFADTIIWNKKIAAPAMARRVLNSQFEYIHIFSNEAKRTIGTRDFKGTLFNVINIGSREDKDLASVHRATFPVVFAEHFVINFTKSTCFDPFGGTGTTLIACEKNARKCFMMELDPKYCDVIIERWQDFTGNEAVNMARNETYDRIKPCKLLT